MKTQTLLILAEQLEVPIDEIIEVNEHYKQHEAMMMSDSPEITNEIAGRMDAIITVAMDEDLSFGVRMGYVISATAAAVSTANSMPMSAVFKELYNRCRENEMRELQVMTFSELMEMLERMQGEGEDV